jgi:hypothetical protein
MDQSHYNAVAVSAVKYCSHEPTVNSRLSDLGDDTAVVARNFGSRHVQREEFTQKPCGGVSVQWKAVFFLIIQCSSSFRSGNPAELHFFAAACAAGTTSNKSL